MPDPQITQLLERGITASRAGRKQEARQVLLEVIEFDERNEQAWLWLSGVVDSLEDRHICLENALAINPDNAHAQAGLRWLDQQPPPSPPPEETCPRCRAPVPSCGRACPHCGQILVVACPDCGEYADVRETSCPACGYILGDFHDAARYHLALAQAYRKQQRHLLAEEAIDQAAAEAADTPQILRDVAALYEQMGDTDRAIAAYEQIITCSPADPAPYLRAGLIYRQRAAHTQARAMLEKAAALARDDPAVLFELAQLYVERDGATAGAITLLQHVVRLDPDRAEAHLALGSALLRRQSQPQAIQHFERACKLALSDSPVNREARRQLGKLRPSLDPAKVQGWGETVRRTAGLFLIPALAALVNARLVPWELGLTAWIELAIASAGAFLWVCAVDVPHSPPMRAVFGQAGLSGRGQQALVGTSGVVLWLTALGLILSRA